MLNWLSGGQSLQDLIATKQWDRAIVQLRNEIRSAPRDSRTRIQLADVLIEAGRGFDAVPVLLKLAQDFALEGSAGRAIAVLKKVERLQPGRSDVQKALAALLKSTTRPMPRPSSVSSGIDEIMRGSAQYGVEEARLDLRPAKIEPAEFLFEAPVALAAPPPSSAAAVRPAPPPPPEDEEPIELEDLVMPPPMSLAEIAALPAPAAATAPAKATPSRAESLIAAMDGTHKDLVDGLLDTIQEVLTEAPPPAPVKRRPRVTSPLFADFSEPDLFAVIQGLELATYGPGDILILEGDPGTSLFIVTAGVVKAFVKQKDGTNRLVREMGEGSFFGEISVLSGKPRTASITAKTAVEALVLERRALDDIVRTHPSVRATLERFASARLEAGK